MNTANQKEGILMKKNFYMDLLLFVSGLVCIILRDSKNSRAARWLRNKWAATPCPQCGIPEWKLEKYAKTFFHNSYGSTLQPSAPGSAAEDGKASSHI